MASARGGAALAQERGAVSGFDHVALPMQNSDAMIAFYRKLGFQVRETTSIVSVYVGNQMMNFHRPSLWQNASFTLRAPAAKPPCGDLCFVWDGSPAALRQMLDRAGAGIETGPADRQGGRQKTGSSVYVRDPDGNLLEFIIYP
jgi:catechol 2,3-dioxygenase-like lactoylglutathione lyase family enzyme